MKIETDDAVLFGSICLFAFGAGLVTGIVTDQLWLGVGAYLIAFGLPSAVVAFMAAGEV